MDSVKNKHEVVVVDNINIFSFEITIIHCINEILNHHSFIKNIVKFAQKLEK